MKLETFKSLLEQNNIPEQLFIFVCNDESSKFVFHQYLNFYSVNMNINPHYLNDIQSVTTPSLFSETTNAFNVICLETLDNDIIPLKTRLWVCCNKLSSKCKKVYGECVVEIPKLEKWHIKDYVYSVLNDLQKSDLDYLLSVYEDNLYRLENEVEKLLLFDDVQKHYAQIKSQLFIDTSEYKVFDFVNALIKYDIITVTSILKNINSIDIDVFGCLKLLLTNFKRVIDIQLSQLTTSESLGISDKQFWVIKKYLCGIYTKNQLLEIYKFLTHCDFLIKSGYISTDNLLDYITLKILTIKERIV